jgi:hypothetical protein
MDHHNNKIGFCFLIKDMLYNQPLWKSYLSGIPTQNYKIYIHYKQKCDIILDNYKFINSIQTKWGDISLIRASLLLFEEAFNDDCDIMFLLSGDTIPLQSYEEINKINTSIFSVQPYHRSKIGFNLKNYNLLPSNLRFKIPKSSWKKQNMFFCITKNNYRLIRKHDQTEYYKNLRIPDEFYFINLFNYFGIKYTSGNYIYANNNKLKTGSIRITNDVFNNDIDTIKNYYFIRKITNYTKIEKYRIFN